MSAVSSSALFQQVAGELRSPTARSSWGAFAILVGSLALFVASIGDAGAREAAMIVGVLLFHEAGHWLGMRVFGYRDVRMFFIPFFGGAVAGEPDGVAAWKQGIVLLLGPLPGLAVACALGIAFRTTHAEWMKTTALALTIVNGLNLAPIEPLDGGRIVHLILASRARFLDVASPVFASVALGFLGVRLHLVTLEIIAGLMLLSVPSRVRVLRAATAVRGRQPELPARIREATDEQLADVFIQVQPVISGAEPITDRRVRALAVACRRVFERATSTPPRWGVSVALGLMQVGGFALGLAAVVLVAARTPGGPLEPLVRKASLPGGAITMHHPASFKAKVTDGESGQTILLTRPVVGHLESVTLITHAGGGVDARAAATRLLKMDGWHVAVGESDQCMGRPGVALDGTIDARREASAFHGCVSMHGDRVVVAYYAVQPKIEEAERAQLRAILDATEYAP